MNWLYYLGEANLYLGAFYLCYVLFLNRETWYSFNRAYLLLSCVTAFILPVIQLGFLKHPAPTAQSVITEPIADNHYTLWEMVLCCYLVGVVIFAIQFMVKLYQLQKLARIKSVLLRDDHKVVFLEGSDTAFSFFNYLFIGTDTTEPELIIRHELVHIRQKHSADIIFLELFKIVNWFNPLVYLLQNSLKAVHEYIADEQTAVDETDTLTYSTFLVNNAYGLSGSSITHSFFNYNLLKKRIIMLHQERSGSLARLKYLVAVPLCAALLCESTLGFSKTYGWIAIGTVQQAPQVPPPPPPVPSSGKVRDQVKLPPSAHKKLTKVPPPPPPAPPNPNAPGVKVKDQVKLPPPPKAKRDVKKLPPPPPEAPKANMKQDAKKLPPPPPEPPAKGKKTAEVVKFPPPLVRPDYTPVAAKKSTEVVKFPPPVVRPNKTPAAPKKKNDVVKFPPPVVRPAKPGPPIPDAEVIKTPPTVANPDKG